MSKLARYLARQLWWAMLWLMRRRWMKDIQAASVKLAPASRRPRLLVAMNRQNRFARRLGLPMLTVAVQLLLASIAITVFFTIALRLAEDGVLTVPDDVQKRIDARR